MSPLARRPSRTPQAAFSSICLPSALKPAILPDSTRNRLTPPNSMGLFSLNPLTGQVTVAVDALDLETTGFHNLQIRMTDSSGLSVTSTLRINIENVNELPVLVDMCANNPAAIGCFKIPENSAVNAAVGVPLRCDDQDEQHNTNSAGRGAGHAISWKIIGGNWGDVFKVGEFSGQISVAAPTLDHESVEFYTLTLTATDNGTPKLGVEATVTIHNTDVNENPVIASGREFKILECGTQAVARSAYPPCSDGNLPLIGEVTVFDQDDSTQDFGQVVFSIDSVQGGLIDYANDVAEPEWGELLNMEDQPTFKVVTRIDNDDSNIVTTHARSKKFTAEIRFAAGTLSFDHEGDVNIYKIALRATDSRYAKSKDGATSNVEDVIVRLRDRNEGPVFNPFDNQVAEISARRTLVGYPLLGGAKDEDKYADQELQFTIIGGDPDGLFGISKCEGQLKVNVPLLPSAKGLSKGQIDMRVHSTLNFESGKTWPLVIKICDDHPRKPLCTQGVSTVSLTDVNEPPYLKDTAFSTLENRHASDVIGTMMPSYSDDDRCATCDGDRPKFYITDGNTIDSIYSIGLDDGVVRVRNPIINFENKMVGRDPVYDVEITVVDKSFRRASARATITVKNVNERPTVASRTMFIAENSVVNDPQHRRSGRGLRH